MASDRLLRATPRLGAALGTLYLVLGVVEGVVHRDDAAALAFWLPALVGGGALVLVGTLRVKEPAWASTVLVTVGVIGASLATAWTIVLPLVGAVLLWLVITRPGRVARV